MRIILLLCLFFPLHAWGQVYKYVDSTGTTHYVSSAKDVPDQYRDQVEKPASLPNIGKGDYSRYADVKTGPGRGKRVEIYVTSWCSYCVRAENFFRANGIRFKKYNIETSTIGKKKHREAGGGGVPVIKVGEEVVRGFNEPRLRELFGL